MISFGFDIQNVQRVEFEEIISFDANHETPAFSSRRLTVVREDGARIVLTLFADTAAALECITDADRAVAQDGRA